MALTKNVVIDKIEILRNGVVQVRSSTEFFDDDELMGQRYHRVVYNPLTDLNTIPNQRVRAICNFIWTDAVKAAYQAELDAKIINQT